MPLWVTDTQWPPEPSALLFHRIDQEHPALGGAGPSLRAAAPARRTGRGPRSHRGASMGATREGCAPTLQWRPGNRKSGAAG